MFRKRLFNMNEIFNLFAVGKFSSCLPFPSLFFFPSLFPSHWPGGICACPLEELTASPPWQKILRPRIHPTLVRISVGAGEFQIAICYGCVCTGLAQALCLPLFLKLCCMETIYMAFLGVACDLEVTECTKWCAQPVCKYTAISRKELSVWGFWHLWGVVKSLSHRQWVPAVIYLLRRQNVTAGNPVQLCY